MLKKIILKNNKSKIILITMITLFLFVIATVFLAGKFLTYSYILNKVNHYTGLNIELVKPSVKLDNKLNINILSDALYIKNKNKTIIFLEAKKPNISFKPLGLLFKKISFANLDAETVVIKIKRDEKGNVDLINSLAKKDWSFLEKNKFTLNRLNSKIDNFEFNFEDKYKIPSSTKLILKNSQVTLSKKKKILTLNQEGIIETRLNSNTQKADISIRINSKYPINNFNTDTLDAKLQITNINLFVFNDLLKKYISKDIEYIKGTAGLKVETKEENGEKYLFGECDINNPNLVLKDNKVISSYKTGLKASSKFKIIRNTLYLTDADIKGAQLLINTKGEINKLFTKNPRFDVQTKITDTQINNFLYFLPDNLIFYRPKGIPSLKKSDFHALLNGVLNIKYSPVEITGNIKASNVHIPNYPKPYRQNDVSAMFMKDKVRIYTRVYTPDNQYVTVDGVSNLDDSLWGKYSVTSTPKIDLKYAQMYLVPIQQIIGFNIGPVPIMDISGYGNIDIKTQGTIKDAQIFGQFSAYSASASIEGVDAKLTNGNCKLVFDNRKLIFKEIKGKMDGADFIMTGTGTTKGDVSLRVKIQNAALHNVLKIVKSNIITKPFTKLTENLSAVSGRVNAEINLEGIIDDFENKDFFGKLTPAGEINLLNNKIVFNNKMSVKNLKGKINFGEKQEGVFEGYLGSTKFNFLMHSNTPLNKIRSGTSFDFESGIHSDKISFKDIISEFKNSSQKYNQILNAISDIDFYSKLDLKSKGKISINNINLNSFNHDGYITGLNSSQTPDVVFKSGTMKFSGKRIIFDNFKADVLSGQIDIRGSIDNLRISLNDISTKKIEKLFSKFKLSEGLLKSGQIILKGENVKLNNISFLLQDAPLFFNASVKNIYKNPYIDADFSTLLNEINMDNIVNPYLTYPVKIKGEIPVKGKFKGDADRYSIDFSAAVPKGSDISFSGANLGDDLYKREISGRVDIDDNIASFNNLRLVKYIANQNNKINPLVVLKANGRILQKENNFYFNNFKVLTHSPLNVRILNLIFKKSLLKKGTFECDIVLNDNVKTPKAKGKANLHGLDIPLYDTQIHDILLDINDKNINGEVIVNNKQSDVKIDFSAKNETKPPYVVEKINIDSNKLNIEDILSMLAPQTQKTDINLKQDVLFKPYDLIVKNGSFEFREVQYDKIIANNLTGKFKYNDEVFDMEDIRFDIADGSVNANGSYNFKSTKLNLNADMKNCDSNTLAQQFLKASGQIFGSMDGSINLTAKNLNTPEGIKNIKSDINFSINEGKMPKLGSLEYLLRAGNLIKSGILGLSLNNIIEVLTPYKTGEFEKISGNLKINSAEVENLEIMSQGKNLSMYLTGKYNILENFADIKIYGKLSQNVSNALGAVGNASLKQFVNSISPNKNKDNPDEQLQIIRSKIPSIKTQEPEPRYFTVKVLGDINKDNYIKHFKWE